MGALLTVVLVVQFRTKGYRPGVYWPAVALISVVGTLVSDNLTAPAPGSYGPCTNAWTGSRPHSPWSGLPRVAAVGWLVAGRLEQKFEQVIESGHAADC